MDDSQKSDLSSDRGKRFNFKRLILIQLSPFVLFTIYSFIRQWIPFEFEFTLFGIPSLLTGGAVPRKGTGEFDCIVILLALLGSSGVFMIEMHWALRIAISFFIFLLYIYILFWGTAVVCELLFV